MGEVLAAAVRCWALITLEDWERSVDVYRSMADSCIAQANKHIDLAQGAERRVRELRHLLG